jgi:hypothetical protein
MLCTHAPYHGASGEVGGAADVARAVSGRAQVHGVE